MKEEWAIGIKIVYGTIELKMPKVYEWEIEIRNIKREARKLYNAGNNERKMNGQPLKRFIAKQKVRKRKVSESDTMKWCTTGSDSDQLQYTTVTINKTHKKQRSHV